MKDGRTIRISRTEDRSGIDDYLASHRASLIIEKGPAAGEEYLLESAQTVVGRSPDVDFSFCDDAMSREHVAFELQESGFRVRDLASTNGMKVNGGDTLVAEILDSTPVPGAGSGMRAPAPAST